jgi:hypothetical protein
MKQRRTVQTLPDHHLTLFREKKSTKWSRSVITDVTEGLDNFNTSSNGKVIRRPTTHGNQLIKSTPRS